MSLKLKFVITKYYKTFEEEIHFYVNGEYQRWDYLESIGFSWNTRWTIEYLTESVFNETEV